MAAQKTLHFNIVSISRNKTKPDKAVAALAYRGGYHLRDEKEDKIHRYGERKNIERTALLAPDDAPAWTKGGTKEAFERYGNEVEAICDRHKRRNEALLMKDFQVALPRELSQEQNWELVLKFSEKFTEKGLMVAAAFHEPDAADGGKNPHAHLAIHMRQIDEKGFAAQAYRSLDFRGKRKENAELQELRRDYVRLVNEALADAGVTGVEYVERWDDDRMRTVHEGKSARALKEKGHATFPDEYNRLVAFENDVGSLEDAVSSGWSKDSKDDWRKRLMEFQLLRESAMASRDATQKNLSSVAPPADRVEKAVEAIRYGARLAVGLMEERKEIVAPENGFVEKETQRRQQERGKSIDSVSMVNRIMRQEMPASFVQGMQQGSPEPEMDR